MKRIIPFLLLAVALGACQDEGPTDLSETPLFAKPDKCEPWPECKDGNGGQYSAIDLKLCKRCGGVAHDISEPNGGVLHVVGWMDEPMGWPRIPVVWIGTMGALAEAEPVILSTSARSRGW